jgi:predicted metalloprotease with PDZ domain
VRRALLVLFPLLFAAAQESAPPVSVSYTLDVTKPESGTAAVEMRVENNRDDEVTLGIPVWAPGSYRVVSYYLGVQNLEAEVGGKKVEVAATDHRSQWKLKTGGAASFTIRYTLKPQDVPPLRGHLTADHYDLQGPSAWLHVKDRLNGPHKVTFKLPPEWKAGTGLEKLGEATFGARDYDTFIDCPIELGTFDLHSFTHGGVTYELVVHATEPFDTKKLIDDCGRIAAEQTKMFGGAPFNRYVFIYHFRSQMGGAGLEHLNSTHIAMSMSRIKQDARNAASITSHEFFHLWNVKRIRPKELGPFDYSQPVRSKALWLCEGVTSYYGDLTLARAGIWSRDAYLRHLASEVTALQANPARKTQSVEQSSWTVWDRARGDRTPSVDYYNKGELLGWLIDLRIRHATGGRASFDDVMRHLYRTHVTDPAKKGAGPIGVGFEEGAILKAVNEISGSDFTDFFAKHISGTEELPYADVLKDAGLAIGRQKTLPLRLRDLQVGFEPPADSDAGKAGVKRNDRVVKVNDTDIKTAADLATALESREIGEKVRVQLTRAGEEQPIRIEVAVSEGSYAVTISPTATGGQKALLEGWLAPSR